MTQETPKPQEGTPMAYWCNNCQVGWHPYQAVHGCPVCGSGTKRTRENASPEAQERWHAAVAGREVEDRAVWEMLRALADLPAFDGPLEHGEAA